MSENIEYYMYHEKYGDRNILYYNILPFYESESDNIAWCKKNIKYDFCYDMGDSRTSLYILSKEDVLEKMKIILKFKTKNYADKETVIKIEKWIKDNNLSNWNNWSNNDKLLLKLKW